MLIRRKVCVVVPCYNPPLGWETRLADRYAALLGACADMDLDFSLSITNDGSTRNVDEGKIRQLFPEVCYVFYKINKGKGYALRQGVQKNEADFYLMTDVDFPYTTASMVSVLKALQKKGGIAAGNRDASYYENVPFVRMLISKALRWMLQFFLRLPVSDSQCGLKGFDEKGKAIFIQTTIDRFLFDLEFLVQANKQVLVYPVPVDLRPGVVFSKVGFRILQREGRNFLMLFFRKIFRKRLTGR